VGHFPQGKLGMSLFQTNWGPQSPTGPGTIFIPPSRILFFEKIFQPPTQGGDRGGTWREGGDFFFFFFWEYFFSSQIFFGLQP